MVFSDMQRIAVKIIMTTFLCLSYKSGREHDLEIKFEATPYRPAVMYLRNGDPGYPAEGGEIEDVEVYMVHGKRKRRLSLGLEDALMTEAFMVALEEAAADAYADSVDDGAQDRADAWEQARAE